jgi:GBP family porin
LKYFLKGLFALTALIAMQSSMAQSSGSSVVLYGRIDTSIETTQFAAAPGARAQNIVDEAKDTSYWGLRGNENLGGGMGAYFKLESGFYPDTGVLNSTTAFFSREAYVGLRGSMGSLQLGSQYSPALLMTISVDPFQRVTNGSNLNLMQSSAGIKNRGYVSVVNNAVHYISPDLHGLTLRAMYGFGEATTDPKDLGNYFSAGAEFIQGPLYVGFTYEDLKIAGVPASDVWDNKTYTFGTTYDLNVVKLYGYLLRNSINNAGNVNGYSLGLTAPVGSGTVRAAYAGRKTDGDAGSKSTVASIGYTYYLSKATSLYTTYSRLENGATADVGLLPSTRTYGLPAMGQDIQGFEVGMRMMF